MLSVEITFIYLRRTRHLVVKSKVHRVLLLLALSTFVVLLMSTTCETYEFIYMYRLSQPPRPSFNGHVGLWNALWRLCLERRSLNKPPRSAVFFIFSLCLHCGGSTGGWRLVPTDSGWGAGSTLAWLPVCHKSDTQGEQGDAAVTRITQASHREAAKAGSKTNSDDPSKSVKKKKKNI